MRPDSGDRESETQHTRRHEEAKRPRDARDLASLYGAQCFVLPVKPREFMDLVDRALGTTIAT